MMEGLRFQASIAVTVIDIDRGLRPCPLRLIQKLSQLQHAQKLQSAGTLEPEDV